MGASMSLSRHRFSKVSPGFLLDSFGNFSLYPLAESFVFIFWFVSFPVRGRTRPTISRHRSFETSPLLFSSLFASSPVEEGDPTCEACEASLVETLSKSSARDSNRFQWKDFFLFEATDPMASHFFSPVSLHPFRSGERSE